MEPALLLPSGCALLLLLFFVAAWVNYNFNKPKIRAQLPSSLLSGTANSAAIVEGLRSLALEHVRAVKEWDSRTHLQQIDSGPAPNWERLVESRWLGRMLHLEGVVGNVTLFEPGDNEDEIVWLWLTAKLPTGGGLCVIAEFDRKWRTALTSLDKGSRVHVIASFKSIRVETSGQVIPESLMAEQVDTWLHSDPPVLSKLSFRVAAVSIAGTSG